MAALVEVTWRRISMGVKYFARALNSFLDYPISLAITSVQDLANQTRHRNSVVRGANNLPGHGDNV